MVAIWEEKKIVFFIQANFSYFLNFSHHSSSIYTLQPKQHIEKEECCVQTETKSLETSLFYFSRLYPF